eukprot:13752506-Alexandrium_andersonii.AAC.1
MAIVLRRAERRLLNQRAAVITRVDTALSTVRIGVRVRRGGATGAEVARGSTTALAPASHKP